MAKKKYKWFANIRRYRDRRGRFVAERTISGYVDSLTQALSTRIYNYTTALVEDFNEVGFIEWRNKTRSQLETLHNAVTVLALGGEAATIAMARENSPVWGYAEAAQAQQLGFFDAFVLGIIAGVVSQGNMANRASMYGLAGFATYQNAVRIREEVAENGYRFEKRVLQSQNPCEDCIAEWRRGWQPIGTLRRLGDSVCRSRCRCYFVYSYTNPDD